MSIIWTIIIGFIAGVIAKFIMPGDNEPRVSSSPRSWG
ncbi:Transglycosylaseassociated protein [Bradyrhizobium sp.]|nr:Transglycosylaseassociated protein [Bradyrhizobium sp.]